MKYKKCIKVAHSMLPPITASLQFAAGPVDHLVRPSRPATTAYPVTNLAIAGPPAPTISLPHAPPALVFLPHLPPHFCISLLLDLNAVRQNMTTTPGSVQVSGSSITWSPGSYRGVEVEARMAVLGCLVVAQDIQHPEGHPD
ncbi:hypothetical protein OUZ56_025350 [Daphnia magna]|uniref:Uncharacterized protein n=1 Tax=Daphnia magna TaxID=35525 RepID=A0ABQ9ZJL3_9CRUS|nr:hypothetical protein OUZ56_025350 [Daphnia magna]